MIQRHNNCIQSYNGSLRKVLRSELSFSREGTCRRPQGLITKSLKRQCCSRCSLPKMLSNIVAQNITEEARKEKTCSGVQKNERPLAVNITIKKKDTPPQSVPRKYQELKDDLFKEHLWELLPVFQRFKQFDVKIRCFILKFRKLFSHRILKNDYTCFNFLRVCRKVFP